MAKAQKKPEGDQSNRDIVAQLQRTIDQLEAERDAAQISNGQPGACEGQHRTNLRGGAGAEEDVHPYKKDLVCGLSRTPTPPLPPRNPARQDKRPPIIPYLRLDPPARSSSQTELDEVLNLITYLDNRRTLIEPQILLQVAKPNLDQKHMPKELILLIVELDNLLELRQEFWREAKLLAWPDDAAMEIVRGLATTATTSGRALRLHKDRGRPQTTEAILRGDGSTQSTVEEGEVQHVVPGSFPDGPAPPIPARNPARLRGEASSSSTLNYTDSDFEREIATLDRGIVRASQQVQARANQVAPSSYLASLEADNVERLVARRQDLLRRRARTVTSPASPSTRRDSGTGIDAETQAERSAIWRSLTAAAQAVGEWASEYENNSAQAAAEPKTPVPQPSAPPAPTHPPYRILNCQDWIWVYTNWQFDNLSPSRKISLLIERGSWLARQRSIQEERLAIDNEIARLRSLTTLERDSATCTNNVTTPGFDGLGNWVDGWVARRYNGYYGSR